MLRTGTLRFVTGAAFAVSILWSADPETADFSKRLIDGQQLRAHDRFADARNVFQTLLRDVRKDGNQRLEGLVLDNLALNEQDRGDYAAAETAFNHGLAAVRGEGSDSAIAIGLKTHLAELYIAEVRPEEGEPLLRQAIAASRSSEQHDLIALSVANEDLAVVCIMRRKFDEPEALLRQAQALIENAAGPDDPKLTASLLTYAGLLTAQHRYEEAIAPAEHAWHIVSANSAHIPKPYQASALSVLGAVYYHAGRTEEAEKCARKSVDLAEASLGPQHPRLGLYLANYATILKRAGRKNEAREVQKKADEIMDQYPASPAGGYTVNVAALH